MTLFRYGADRFPVALIVGLFVLDVAVFSFASSIAELLVWLVVIAFPKAFICAWNHHHHHVPTFRQRLPNRALELVYAMHTGVSPFTWTLHHNLGHHVNYLVQEKDESSWMRRSGKTMGELEYTLVIAATGYIRAFRVGLGYPRLLIQFCLLSLPVIGMLGAALWWNWLNALFVFVVPMFGGYLMTCWHTYAHHAGLHTDDPLQASHNIRHRLYNVLTGNLGLHTAHHMKPGLHWSKLPEFHRTIEHRIPARLFVEPIIPIKWLPSATDSYAVRHPLDAVSTSAGPIAS